MGQSISPNGLDFPEEATRHLGPPEVAEDACQIDLMFFFSPPSSRVFTFSSTNRFFKLFGAPYHTKPPRYASAPRASARKVKRLDAAGDWVVCWQNWAPLRTDSLVE